MSSSTSQRVMITRTLPILVAVLILAIPVFADRLGARWGSFIPKDIGKFWESVTVPEELLLKKLYDEGGKTIKTKEQLLEKLKATDESLFQRAQIAYNNLEKKLASLDGDVKKFAEEYVTRSKRGFTSILFYEPIHTNRDVKDDVDEYKSMSVEAKQQFKQQFPEVANAFETSPLY